MVVRVTTVTFSFVSNYGSMFDWIFHLPLIVRNSSKMCKKFASLRQECNYLARLREIHLGKKLFPMHHPAMYSPMENKHQFDFPSENRPFLLSNFFFALLLSRIFTRHNVFSFNGFRMYTHHGMKVFPLIVVGRKILF